MYILILIISLKSQFNHALDVRTQALSNSTQQSCIALGEKISAELKSFNRDVETKYFCEKDNTIIIKG